MSRLKQMAFLCLVAGGLAAPLVAQSGDNAPTNFLAAPKGGTWPEAVLCGQSFTVDVTMMNTSRAAWTESGYHKLGPVKGEEEIFRPDGFLFKMPEGTEVPLRGEHTFTLELAAPEEAGTYETEWSMMVKGTPYGVPVKRAIRVYCDDAELGRALFPEEVACGEAFTAEVRMKNNGASTWTEAEFYKLGPVLDIGEPFRGDGHKVKMPDGTEVPVGEKYVFELELTAPEEAGVYETKWSMMKGGHPFGEQVSRSIEVVCKPKSGSNKDGRS